MSSSSNQWDAANMGYGRRILPQNQEDTLKGVEDKREKALGLLHRLHGKLADHPNPEVHQRLANLGAQEARSAALIRRLRYAMEYRHELKRMGLRPEQVRALIPHRSTPWGAPPMFVVGLYDTDGNQHLFQRPIRVWRAE